MKIVSTKKDVAWNYIGVIFAMTSNFILLPISIHYLNSDNLGLWYVFVSVGSITTMFDFGFNASFSRHIAYSWSGAKELKAVGGAYANETSEVNYQLLKNVLGTCRVVYLFISLIALVCLTTVGTFYIKNISGAIQGSTHMIAWYTYVVAIFLNLLLGYNMSLLKGIGAIRQYNQAIVISRVIQIVISAILLISGVGILSLTIGYLMYGLIFRVLAMKSFLSFQNVGVILKKFSYQKSEIKMLLKEIWPNTWKDGLVSLSNYLSSQASTILCSLFFTLSETGAYSIAVQMASAVASVSAAFYSAKQPMLQSSFIRNDITEMKRTISVVVSIYWILYLFGTIGVVLVGMPILKLIKPESVTSIPMYLLIAVYYLLYKRQTIYASCISNMNKIPYMKPYIISSVASIGLALILIYLIPNLGIYNMIGAQILVQASYNNWRWPRYVQQELGLSSVQMITIFKNTVRRDMER